jgi:predicted Zn-dependent protease with MMP-like domain
MENAPSLVEFEAMTAAAFASLPEDVRAACAGVVLRVEDWPSGDQLSGFDAMEASDLTGLYEGIPLTEKSVMDAEPRPDLIWLFRRPILAEWAERGTVTLQEMISHVLVHELAHHFGWSDNDIAEIDRWWE